jgi:hypothetical protein
MFLFYNLQLRRRRQTRHRHLQLQDIQQFLSPQTL